MTTDPTPEDALRSRAERGTPRGADEVLAAARTSAGDADAVDAPLPTISSRSNRWALTAAAAAIVLVAVGVGVAIAADRDSTNAASGGPFCEALAASSLPPYDIDADVMIYIAPGADGAVVDQVSADLQDDPQIVDVRYVDLDETYERFRQLFRDEDTMLDNVEPSDLPTSFEVTVTDDAEPNAVAVRWRSNPNVWEVRDRDVSLGRVLDVLVWPGNDPRVTRDDFIHPMSGEVKAGWDERVQDLSQATPPELIRAVDVLVRALSDRLQPLDPDDPEARRAAAAAAALTDAARTECGLAPRSLGIPTSGATAPTTTTTSPPVPTTAPGTTTSAPSTTTSTPATTTTAAPSTTADVTTTSSAPGTTTSIGG